MLSVDSVYKITNHVIQANEAAGGPLVIIIIIINIFLSLKFDDWLKRYAVTVAFGAPSVWLSRQGYLVELKMSDILKSPYALIY